MGGERKGEGGDGRGQQRREGVGGRERGKDGSQGGGGAEEILHKRGGSKCGGLGKKYFKGGPGQKGVNQILGGGGGYDLG